MYNSDNVLYNSDKHVRTKEYKPLKPIGKKINEHIVLLTP